MGDTIEIIEQVATVLEVAGPAGPQGPQGATGSGLGTLTTQGDTLYQGASAAQRLPIGTAGQILKVNSGGTAPEWGAAPASGVSSVNGETGTVILDGSEIDTSGNDDSAAFFTYEFADGNGIYYPIPDSTLNSKRVYRTTTGHYVFFQSLRWHITDGSPNTQNIIESSEDDNAAWPWLSAWDGSIEKAKLSTVVGRARSTFLFVGDSVPNTSVSGLGTAATADSTAFAAASHTHGNLTNDGKIGTTANLPLKTGTNGVVEAGSFSNTAGSFCAGDDVRLSDARTAVAHAASHTAGSKASFFGTVSGMTGTVWIIANDAGTAGNSITLSFNGTSDIETVLAAWNSANPSNTASVSDYGGSTSQVPSNGQTITLSGGVNAGSDSIADDTTPRFDSLIVGGGQGGAAFNWINSGEHLAHIVCQDGTSQTPLVMFGGSAQFIVFQDHNISSGFAHGLAIPGQPPDGIYRLTLYNGSSWNPKIIVPQTGTIELTENISLKDLDNEFAATFDVQSQLSDDVTLTIPDQSGTLAVVTDIPTTAGDVGAVAAGAITTSGLTQATARILGRTSSSTGAVEEIQIGSGLSLSAGELSATGAGVTAVGASTADVLSVSGSDLVADDPNADRIVFFDDSEGKLRYLEAGSGLSISGTTMTVTATGGATNLWIPASAWIPRTTTGCGVDSRETSTNKQNFDELLFDAGTDEFAQALVIMPSNYNNSTITARFYWTAASGSGDVIWGLQGRAFANDDALDTAHGTAQTATDTLLAADDMHVSAATSAVTIGGTPAANTPIQLQVYRDADAGGDTLAVDARLLGVEIIFN